MHRIITYKLRSFVVKEELIHACESLEVKSDAEQNIAITKRRENICCIKVVMIIVT